MCFLGIQILNFATWYRNGLIGRFDTLSFDIGLFFLPEHHEFLLLWCLLTLIVIAFALYATLFAPNRKEREAYKMLTKEEKARTSKLASKYEIKRGLSRLEYDNEGNLKNKSVRIFFDKLTNPIKILNNKIVRIFKLSDRKKMNQLKRFKIGENIQTTRSGAPILTYRRRSYVDSGDNHTIVVGTTNSGKTFSFISPLIQLTRIAGESMIITDVKGELYDTHAGSLMENGYDVKRIDFIDPKKSDAWNPLSSVTKLYREADREHVKLLKEEYFDKLALCREYMNEKKLLLSGRDIDQLNDEEIFKFNEIKNTLTRLFNEIPKPDYSEAQELVRDFAMQLCYEPEAKDPYWSTMAQEILEGYIYLLLEEKGNNNGLMSYLSDEQISMYAVKMLHTIGEEKINVGTKEKPNIITKLQYYLQNFRGATSNSYMKLSGYLTATGNTKASLSSVFSSKLATFMQNDNVLKMLSKDDFDVADVGRKKMAIFISVHDEKSTYHGLVTMFIQDVYNKLIAEARKHNGRLLYPVNVIWDEFANGAPWNNIDNGLAAGRSRGIRFYLVVQDYNQLKTRYHDKAETIKSNCANTIFLLANENVTLKDLSDVAGERLVWNKSKCVYESVPVISKDRLRKMSLGEALIIRSRYNPALVRLKGFNEFNFYKNLAKTEERPIKKYPNLSFFDMTSAINELIQKKKKESISSSENSTKEKADTKTNKKSSKFNKHRRDNHEL